MTLPHLGLTEDPHDRAAHRRHDDAWLEERWADSATRVLVVAGARVRPVDGRIDWRAPADAPPGERVLLGERDGRTWFAVLAEDDPGQDPDQWVGLRALLQHLADDTSNEAPLVFHAIGLAEWHRSTKFCPRCGGPLESRAAGHELACGQCGRHQFPRSDPAVIMAVTYGEPGTPEERILLGRQSVWPPRRYSTLAGFCEPGESLEDAVRREVHEEVGVRVGEVRYFGNQPWPFPASLMVGFTAVADTTAIVVDEHELEDAQWFTRRQLEAGAEDGSLVLPGGVSISRSLVESWYGGPLPGTW